jgi:tetratricopeptide (TPR) repeat protein
LAPEDSNVLSQVAQGLVFIGDVQEALRHAERAVAKAPGSGIAHYVKGTALVLASQPERAIPALESARRLMPGSYLMIWIECWRANALYLLRRWEAWDDAVDACISLYPEYGLFQVFKARLCLEYGRETEALDHILQAHRLGFDAALTDLHWRRTKPNCPWLKSDLASIGALYAAIEGKT